MRPLVSVVVDDLKPYGAQRVAALLASSLCDLGAEVELVTIEPSDGVELPVPGGVERAALRRPRGGARGYASIVAQLRAHLAARRPRLVISHMMLSNVACIAAVRLTPRRRRPAVVATEHSRPSQRLREESSPGALLALGRLLYPRATRVIGVSRAVTDDTGRLFRLRSGQTETIMNALDSERIRALAAAPPPHPWLRGELARQTIVCVGELRAAKGQDVLVRALAGLPRARALFVGGGGTQLGEVRALASTLGLSDRTDFVGYRADAPAYMAAAAVVAVPSRREGFGLVALEAAALGVRVVGSAVAGLDELVPAHAPGELVAPDDPEALAGALERALEHGGPSPRASLECFSPARVGAAYLRAGGLR